MSDLLIELFSEELPARMQHSAMLELTEKLKSALCTNFCDIDIAESWVTPRRLGFYFDGINLTNTSSKTEEVRGPRVNAPEAAFTGFLNKYKITKSDLIQKGEYYYAELTTEAIEPKTLIKNLVEDILKNYVWPKSIKWSDKNITWVRPLHSIICLLDNEILPVQYGHIKASNVTCGHRFADQKIIKQIQDSNNFLTISSYADYKDKLKKLDVIIHPEDRKSEILTQIENKITPLNLKLIMDDELLNEIIGLVEKPTVYIGEIDQQFMKLPREVLIITLKHHQRYLMLEDTHGNIAPYYIIVSNINAIDGGTEIIKGNNKVLAARLFDAKFFVDNDKTRTLESRVEDLSKLTFHAKLGSVYEKTQSVIKIASNIADMVGVDNKMVTLATKLSKADLTTGMVKEFPELQGTIGYYYALNDGIEKDVAIAIREHYKPLGPSDSLPSNAIASVVALADKIDTLNQMFGIGIKPTGSKDPYALRRAAIGILRIISLNNWQSIVNLESLTIKEVHLFIEERAKMMA